MHVVKRSLTAAAVAVAGFTALSLQGSASAVTWQLMSSPTIEALPDSATSAWGLSASTDGTVSAVHWNGTAWSSTALTRTATESAIAGSGAANAWVVGSRQVGYDRHQPYFTHFNGSAWTEFALPDDGASEALSSVAMVSPSDVWAAGSNLLAHWNGSRWSRVTRPAPSGAAGSEIQLVTASGSGLWAAGTAAVGGSTVEFAARWDGTSWAVTSTLAAAAGHWWEVYNIAASSPTNAWLSITDNDQNFDTTALAAHWNGTSWTITPMPAAGTMQTLTWIAASGNDAYAVGTYENNSGDNAFRAVVYHWNGSAWARVPFPVTSAYSAAARVGYVPGTGAVWVSGGETTGDFAARTG
ncbi:MAG: hypothetical protein JOY82_13945 [Streptosporangiaceae bacterium]|nr:hypothetical protein [Streptosporangiaceae bacterium]MBV9855594.1 hypothetical protein [Streptosporangiaceae bacterium]